MSLRSSEKGDKREEVKKTSADNQEEQDVMKVYEHDDVKSLVADLQAQINELKQARPISEASDDDYDAADDYLEIPAVFFCFSYEYSIHADKRNGRTSLPPLGSFIKFKKLYRYGRKAAAGRGTDVVSVSQATVRSKAEAEWLRKHSLFNIKFFENLEDAKSVDTTLAEKMTEHASRVSSMSDMQVIEKCRSNGVAVHSDLDKLRKELIQKLASDDIKNRKKSIQDHLKKERDDEGRMIQPSILADKEVKESAERQEGENVY